MNSELIFSTHISHIFAKHFSAAGEMKCRNANEWNRWKRKVRKGIIRLKAPQVNLYSCRFFLFNMKEERTCIIRKGKFDVCSHTCADCTWIEMTRQHYVESEANEPKKEASKGIYSILALAEKKKRLFFGYLKLIFRANIFVLSIHCEANHSEPPWNVI